MACITNKKCIKCEQLFASYKDFELTCYDCIKKEKYKADEEARKLLISINESIIFKLKIPLGRLKNMYEDKGNGVTSIPAMKIEEAIMWIKKDLEILRKTKMNQNDYEFLKGRLLGLREARVITGLSYGIDARIKQLESQIKSAVVIDEVAELKAKNKELKEMVEKLLNLDKIYLNPVEIGKALKSLEGKDEHN